jgi:sigma-E factor negative regulatory protein RseA
MTDERTPSQQHEQQPGERHEERDSQLSAMFDGELPGAECELLARRLTRDEALRAQWSRYSMIGAALRAERGVALHDRVAWRVQAVIAQEPTYGEGGSESTARTPSVVPVPARAVRRWQQFAWPAAGASIAAGVAAVSIFWLRGMQPGDEVLQASVSPPAVSETVVVSPEATGTTIALSSAPTPERTSNGEPERYTTPAPSSSTSIVPPARLANYVVAHSEYSGPLSRRMALLGIMGEEGTTADAVPVSVDEAGEANPDAN